MGKKNYLVTGGTGFIGSALVLRLVKDGYKVRVFDNDIRGSASRLDSVKDKVEMIQGDIRDAQQVEDACKGVDGVIHLAYINGTEYFYKMPDLVLDVGVNGMMNILEGCIKNGVKELILASSSEVYQTPPEIPTDETAPLIVPDPLNPRYSYGGGKIISELLALNYGRKHFDRVLIFRPHNVYGPDMGWEHVIPQFVLRMKDLSAELKDEEMPFPLQGSGKEKRAFVFIDDFIDGLMVMLQKGEHLNIYHIGTMDEVMIEEVAREIGTYFNKKLKLSPGKLQQGSTLRRCPDTSKLQKLRYAPKVSLEEGIKKTVEWYVAHADEVKKIGG